VQFVSVAGVRPDLLADPLDGVGIEPAKVTGLHGQAPTELDGPAAALLQWRVVQIGERPPVQDLVRQD
jgi:hypothetical protein